VDFISKLGKDMRDREEIRDEVDDFIQVNCDDSYKIVKPAMFAKKLTDLILKIKNENTKTIT